LWCARQVFAANKIGFRRRNQTTLNDLFATHPLSRLFSGGEDRFRRNGDRQRCRVRPRSGTVSIDPWLLPTALATPDPTLPATRNRRPSNPGSDIPSTRDPTSLATRDPTFPNLGADVPIGGLLATPDPCRLVLSSIASWPSVQPTSASTVRRVQVRKRCL